MIPSIMAVVRAWWTRGAVNGADPRTFLASRPKRRYQQWTATQHSITKWCPVVPLAVLWLLASPSPPGGSLERVIEFLFVWFLSWVSRGYLCRGPVNLVMAACGLHVVLLIIKHAAFLFLLFNIQIGLLMYVDASCWSLSLIITLCNVVLLAHNSMRASWKKTVSPISKCLMAHFQLSLPFFELSH